MSILNIGLSGLNAASANLDGISQNISNSDTAGYKSVSTQFEAAYSGSEGTGTTVSGTTQSFDVQGDAVSTDDDLDLDISGTGFFVLSSGNGTYAYTRNGEFSTDSDYNIVASNGMYVQGYGVDANGNIASGTITTLSVSKTSIPAEASTTLTLTANLNADATTIDTTSSSYSFSPSDSSTYNYSISTDVYDSQGTSHTLTQYYVKTDDNSWSVYYALDGATVTTTDSSGNTSDVTSSLTFNSDGTLTSPTSDISLSLNAGTSVNTISLSIDPSNITQYASDFSSTSSADGYTSGTLSSVYFDSSGNLYATYDNGETELEGQAVLASFNNPDGLEAADGTVWYASSSSGSPTYGTADTGSFGSLTVGSYENSNVDISSELVALMSAQQAYQANAKSLTAANDMASVLFNIG